MSSYNSHKTVTIQDVARRAGVAPITVSRAINRSGYVSQATRERVEAAIADLQYVPNMLARSLRSNRTNTLALVLSDISNPFWTTVARGVEDAARAQGYNVILCNTDEDGAKQDEYLAVLLRKQVDGFLLVPAQSLSNPIQRIQQQNVPLVVLDRKLRDARVDSVYCDSEAGAHTLTRHLLDMGHQRIAILTGPPELSVSQERVAGFRRALSEMQVAIYPDLIVCGAFSVEGGKEMARQVMSLDLPPTALFAGNNFIAIGAYKSLRSAGVRVPEDVSMVSFDDLPPPLLIDPFFTAVVQPAYELGRRAIELLLRRIAGSDEDDPQEIVLPTEFIVRHSTRALS